jgi:hypothetical protein
MFNRHKIFAAYLLAIPLALLPGILAASPNGLTFMLTGMLLFFCVAPRFKMASCHADHFLEFGLVRLFPA